MVLLGSYISKSTSYYFSAVVRNTNPNFNHHSFNHRTLFHRNLIIQNCRGPANGILSGHLKYTNQKSKILFQNRVFRTSNSLNLRSTAASSSDEAIELSQLSRVPKNDQSIDTIFALSSGGGGEGGTATAVAVIRISGPKSVQALDMLMNPTSYYNYKDDSNYATKVKKTSIPKPRYAALRTLYEYNPSIGNKPSIPLDQALVLYFPGPNSFSGEDIIELHTHGSRAVVSDVLNTLSTLPSIEICTTDNNEKDTTQKSVYLLRPADRGEFTQRAYTNGKLGLVEVEALADLIVSDTAMQRRQALLQMDGRVTKVYDEWRKQLIKGLAHSEAVIDFGDDEDLVGDDNDDNDEYNSGESLVWGNIRNQIFDLLRNMKLFLQDDRRGEIVRDGVRIAIVGPPNAGKSSLLNLLARRDVAIVSPIAGTTRDVVEVVLDLGGVRCILSDTAGLRTETNGDVIEEEGIRRATKVAKEAHVILFMEDALIQQPDVSTSGIEEIMGLGENNNIFDGVMIKVKNKIDLLDSTQTPPFDHHSEKSPKIFNFGISCSTGLGVDALLDQLEKVVISRVSSSSSSSSMDDGLIITRARHRRHIIEAEAALSRFMELTETNDLMTVDLAAEELRLAASSIGRITGAVDVEEVLDVLFADFCIGK